MGPNHNSKIAVVVGVNKRTFQFTGGHFVKGFFQVDQVCMCINAVRSGSLFLSFDCLSVGQPPSSQSKIQVPASLVLLRNYLMYARTQHVACRRCCSSSGSSCSRRCRSSSSSSGPRLLFNLFGEFKDPTNGSGESTHTLVPCWMFRSLPPMNHCTGCFALALTNCGYEANECGSPKVSWRLRYVYVCGV